MRRASVMARINAVSAWMRNSQIEMSIVSVTKMFDRGKRPVEGFAFLVGERGLAQPRSHSAASARPARRGATADHSVEFRGARACVSE